jgi:hypothetical protein
MAYETQLLFIQTLRQRSDYKNIVKVLVRQLQLQLLLLLLLLLLP